MGLCILRKGIFLFVEFAKKSLSRMFGTLSFVLRSAVSGILIIKMEILSMVKRVLALTARLFLNLMLIIANIVLKIVDGLLIIKSLACVRKVYNLQVYDTHEYFANGILVSNCIMASAIGYAILQEQDKYIDDKSGGEGFSTLRAIFGEDQLGYEKINHFG